MSSFYNIGSSSAKVVPVCLSSPSQLVLITQINKLAMDSSTNPDPLLSPVDKHSKLLLPDDMIQPMILSFEKKIMLNEGSTSDQEGAISCNINPSAAVSNEDKQVISSSAYQASASPEGELWPKLTELDDDNLWNPPDQDAIKQVIRESTYLSPKQSELNIDRPQSPSNEKSEKTQVIEDLAYLFPKQIELNNDRPPRKSERIRDSAYPSTELGNRSPSSPAHYKNVMKPDQMQVIREGAYQSPNEAELDAWKADDEGLEKPKRQVIREADYPDKLSEMKEDYRSSARGRLSKVVEESESFSRREFGANMLNYMSTHSSATHAANLANLSSYTHSNFSLKHPSYHHSNHPNFSYNHSSFQPAGNFPNSKSAPAGTAARSGSTFALFRRGLSEGGNLRGRRTVHRRPRSRKPRSLAHKLLWPLLKIRNGYVGCMMGLEGAGDLSGMAQGGTYATRARYFADIPLSKTDSRNHG